MAPAGTLARLGIMGGTFDPPHLGHLACAEEALEAANLDAVLFVPTGRPAFKQDRLVTAGEVRLAMVAAAVAGNPAFAVSALEVERPGITYAVDTLRELHTLTGGGEYVFRGERHHDRPMSENTVNAALRAMGFGADEVVGHGFRATARTMMAERLELPEAVIEAQLAHAVKDSLGRAYNRTEFEAQRRGL